MILSAPFTQLIIPLVALFIAILSYVVTLHTMKEKASERYVDLVRKDLERQLAENKVLIEELRADVLLCHQERDALMRENIELMRKLTYRPRRDLDSRGSVE